MFALSHKAKQYGLIALKVFILGFTFRFIYQKLTDDTQIGLSHLWEVLSSKSAYNLVFIILFLGMASLNWFLEIIKWRTIVASFKNITFWESLKQCLSSLTVSLATPNRIGEYGAKALYYEHSDRKKILMLNFISNGIQMLVTSLIGFVGLALIFAKYNLNLAVWKVMLGFMILLFLLFVGYKYKENEILIKGLTIKRILGFINNLSTAVKFKIAIYSLLRYLTFCSLFYLILLFFDVQLSISLAAPIISAMYLLVSVIPSIFIFDVVVRGGVAVWLFSLEGIQEWPVLCTVLSMWILNFVFPAFWGSAYVITYQPTKS